VSGEVYDFGGEPSRRVWAPARSPDLATRVLGESLAFLAALASREALPTLSAPP